MHKPYRLKKRKDFNIVYRYGKSVANHQFVLYVKEDDRIEHFQLGVSASKKIGNAVVRNRMRRLVKEIMRTNIPRIRPHVKLILIVRNGAVKLDYHEMKKSILHVCKKAGILEKAAETKNPS